MHEKYVVPPMHKLQEFSASSHVDVDSNVGQMEGQETKSSGDFIPQEHEVPGAGDCEGDREQLSIHSHADLGSKNIELYPSVLDIESLIGTYLIPQNNFFKRIRC